MRKEKRKRQGKRLIVVRIGSKEEKDDLFSRAEGKLFLRESERQTGKTFPRDRPTTQRFCSCCGDNGLTSHPLLSLPRKERRQKNQFCIKKCHFFRRETVFIRWARRRSLTFQQTSYHGRAEGLKEERERDFSP